MGAVSRRSNLRHRLSFKPYASHSPLKDGSACLAGIGLDTKGNDMTISRTTYMLSASLLLASPAAADAADLYGNGSIKDVAYEAPLPVGPSWYVRIDGGYAVHDDPVMTEMGIYDLVDESIDDTWTLGGGIGRYFTPTIRGDITYDHRFEADASGTLLDHYANLNGVRNFGIESDVVLFNLYYDFNHGARFSPYVGAGLGVTHNKTTTGTAESFCGCTGTIESGSDMDVAAALMAGFTTKLRGGQSVVEGGSKDGPMVIDSGRGLYLDVGYRFLYLGDVETGPIVTTTPIADDPTVGSIMAHEFRIGLRYDFR
jgi:opacity protein-like surface antigen